MANLDNSVFADINWLGASYSGVDIKVVAHMYGGVEDINTQLKDDLKQAQEAADAFTALASSGIPDAISASLAYPTISDFISYGAQMNADSKAKSVVAQLYSSFTKDPIKTKVLASNLAGQYNQLVQALSKQVSNIGHMEAEASPTITLGSLQTMSIQSHREKVGVRALGTGYVKGYTRGPRTLAGSLIFTLFDEHPLKMLIRNMKGYLGRYGELDYYTSSMLPDQLPPLDLTIIFANEYGSASRMAIYGVEFINDSSTFSIEDLFSEEIINFVARDVDIMTRHGQTKLSQYERGMASAELGDMKDMTGSDLSFSSKDSYNKYLDRIGLRRRFKNR